VVRGDTNGERGPDLQALAANLYGDFRFVAATKGRAAERLLIGALGKTGATVVCNGLFITTQHALAESGARLEIAPRKSQGTADLDLDWLERRFASGGVDIVYLEPCNNQLGGMVLSRESIAAVSAQCKRHGALLLLDCARLLTNSLALGGPLRDTVRAFTHYADAFTVSCSKELLVPFGSLVAVRDAALERKVFGSAFETGALLEPQEARVRLGRGLLHMAAHGDAVLRERRAQLGVLAGVLQQHGIEHFQPVESHALFIPIDAKLLPDGPASARALEGLLYRLGGVRGLLFPYPLLERSVLRLALPIGACTEAVMRQAGEAVGSLFARAGEAPALAAKPDSLHPGLTRYSLRS
jgi:tryptophanase